MEMAHRRVINVVVTGAATKLAYSLIPMIANGHMFRGFPLVSLSLLDGPNKDEELNALRQEILDCCYPSLKDVRVEVSHSSALMSADVVILLSTEAFAPNADSYIGYSENNIIPSAQMKQNTLVECLMVKAHNICQTVSSFWDEKSTTTLSTCVLESSETYGAPVNWFSGFPMKISYEEPFTAIFNSRSEAIEKCAISEDARRIEDYAALYIKRIEYSSNRFPACYKAVSML